MPPAADPLTVLREYRTLAPWSLRDLAAPRRGAARRLGRGAGERGRPGPTQRAHHPVLRDPGLVSPPDGRGTAAVYSYRHLLQVLAIKLRQMEGATLEALNREFAGMTGDLIERRVAGGSARPCRARSGWPCCRPPGTGRGRVGRAVLLAGSRRSTGAAASGSLCRRIAVVPGIELLIDEQHPVLRLNGDLGALPPPSARHCAGLIAPRLLPDKESRHVHDRPAGRSRGHRPVGDRRLQRAHLPQEPGGQCLEADRRAAEAAPRSHPQPGQHGQGRDGLRAGRRWRRSSRPGTRR